MLFPGFRWPTIVLAFIKFWIFTALWLWTELFSLLLTLKKKNVIFHDDTVWYCCLVLCSVLKDRCTFSIFALFIILCISAAKGTCFANRQFQTRPAALQQCISFALLWHWLLLRIIRGSRWIWERWAAYLSLEGLVSETPSHQKNKSTIAADR